MSFDSYMLFDSMMRPKTELLLALIPLVFILPPRVEAADEATTECLPNVVIIDIDILRADALPCLGHFRDTAPNLCRFASRAVVFERHFSTSFWTLPAIVSTLTSQFPSRHGLFVTPKGARLSGLKAGHLAKGTWTLPRILGAHGYSTHYVGQDSTRLINAKTGVAQEFGRSIEVAGIESWLAIVREVEDQRAPFLIYFYSRGVRLPYSDDNNGSTLPADLRQWSDAQLSPPAGFPATPASLDSATAKLVMNRPEHFFPKSAIDRRPDLFSGEEPRDPRDLLLFLHSIRDELEPPYRHRVAEVIWSAWRERVAEGDESARAYARLQYDTKVRYLDRLLEPLLDHLSGRRAEDTIVVVTSSHGEFIGEHGLVGHQRALFQEVIHTPLIVRIPGIAPGRIGEITQHIDILPTTLDAAGIRVPEAIQGLSLLPGMRRGRGAKERYAISEMGLVAACIQNRSWKLIVERGDGRSIPRRLYDLASDPGEESNLIERESERAEELRRILDEVLDDPATWRVGSPRKRRSLDNETIERAQRHGYF